MLLARRLLLGLVCLIVGGCSDESGTDPAPTSGCGAGQVDCGGGCVSLGLDALNCGSCGLACAPGQVCSGGVCQCLPSTAACGGQCVDVATNAQSCGGCGLACATGQQCLGGACQCQAGLTSCSGQCTLLAGDGSNCGACGVSCAPGLVCSNGACGATCPAPTTQCGSSCVDLANDPRNCGACAATCASPMGCTSGACTCPAGTSSCGGQCVDTLADPSNCGACGTQCTGGTSCSNGTCTCPAGRVSCAGACVDPLTDPSHCGACGAQCTGGSSCSNGACIGGGTGGAGGTGGVSTGGVSTGGVSTGGVSTGGVPTGGAPTGGVSTGGAPTGGVPTGGALTGGVPPTGGAGGTGGSACTNIRPTGTGWDTATCDMWATQTGECANAWMIDNNYCNESCGRCSGGTGGTGGATGGTGGATGGNGGTGGATGGAGGTGGATGGTGGATGGTGGGVVYDCDLPAAGASGVARPSGTPGNLQILNWAGFRGAVTFTFDDATASQIAHYADLQALGVPMTFYLWTNQSGASNTIWSQALRDGHELGNHSQSHPQTGSGSDVDAGEAAIESRFGTTVWTFAAPYGDASYTELARSRYLVNRGVVNGLVAPNDNTNPFSLPCYLPPGGAVASVMNSQIDSAQSASSWRIFLIHGFTGTSDGAYQPVSITEFVSTVNHAKALGNMWLDSMVNVAAYWRAQKMLSSVTPTTSGSDRTWTYTLPAHFPPGKCLRVKVDGGTLKQGGNTLAWDTHGYYQISLDAGPVTLSP